MQGMLLHCGAKAATRDEVFAVETPEPTIANEEKGRGFYPIPHSALIEEAERYLGEAGLTVVNQEHGLTNKGKRYFGLLQVENGHKSDDHGLVVGIRNSHDKGFAAGFALGSRVFVCDNLSFSGEVRLARAHTKYIMRDLPALVARSAGLLQDHRGVQDKRFAAYKEHELGDKDFDHLLIRALENNVIMPTKLRDVLTHWRKPQHEEFEARTLWSAFNAFTEVFKAQPPTITLRRSQILHSLADSECELVVPKMGEKKVEQVEDGEIVTEAIGA